MQKEFGTQMMSFPNISYKLMGDLYTMDFLVDQRKCDLFSLLSSVIDFMENNKDTYGIKVKNIAALYDQNTEVHTMQIDFEQKIGNEKRSKLILSDIK